MPRRREPGLSGAEQASAPGALGTVSTTRLLLDAWYRRISMPSMPRLDDHRRRYGPLPACLLACLPGVCRGALAPRGPGEARGGTLDRVLLPPASPGGEGVRVVLRSVPAGGDGGRLVAHDAPPLWFGWPERMVRAQSRLDGGPLNPKPARTYKL